MRRAHQDSENIAASLVRPRSGRAARRGGASNGLIVMLAMLGGLAVASVVITPRVVKGLGDGATSQTAQDPAHQEALKRLAALISRSHMILAVHARGRTPFVEVALWLEDSANPGVIDRDEFAVISHSEILRTVSMHTLRDEHGEAAAAWPGLAAPAAEPIGPDAATDAEFCERWRRIRDVMPRVLLTDVTDMQVSQSPGAAPDRPRLRIALIWSSESSDAEDKAWLDVDVRMRDHSVED